MTRGHPRPEAILGLIVDFQFCREPGISELDRDERDAEEAHDTECEAVRRGDYNFPGIGKPEDL
jgi:hypothetical protein